jgi:hypothetical protein
MSRFGPVSARLADGRLHLQQGPIDLILEVFAAPQQRETAFAAAQARFDRVLTELVAELPELRRNVLISHSILRGTIARRMAAATAPLAERHFITPMAAVAGAVADEVLEAMTQAAVFEKAYVNNGGDIALFLSNRHTFVTGLAADPRKAQLDGRFTVSAGDPVGGIATSGRHGRSLSLGIADSVTVLARNAAAADAAATVIANSVDLPGNPAIERQAAKELDPDSDLGNLAVTTGLGTLTEREIEAAVQKGFEEAVRLQRAGLIHAAILTLRGHVQVCDAPDRPLASNFEAIPPRSEDSAVFQRKTTVGGVHA